ncbi:MAG: hypothetical protein ACR2J8_08720, partial [Thermomicrobiales bacterium]
MSGAPELLDRVMTAWSAKDYAGGAAACDRLRCLQDPHPDQLDYARQSQLFFVRALDDLAPGFRAAPVEIGTGDGATVARPGLLPLPGGALLLVRAGRDDAPIWRAVATGPEGAPLAPARPVAGRSPLASAQPLWLGEQAAVVGIVEDEGTHQLAIARFDPSGLAIGRVSPLGDPDPALADGPWPAAVLGGVLWVIRTLHPTIGMRCDLGSGSMADGSRMPAPPLAADLA